MKRRKFLKALCMLPTVGVIPALAIENTVTHSDGAIGFHKHRIDDNKGALTAFYGDITDQRIVGIDVSSMTLTSDTSTEGLKPYTVGRADGINGNSNKLYGMTRNSLWVEIIDINTRELEGKIDLLHTPRSCAYNEKLGLQLISGVDKPMSSLIDPVTDKVVATVGRNTLVNPQDFGGSNATGHPVWLSKNIFAVLDREVRKIDVYKIKRKRHQWKVKLLSSLTTSTSAHHFIGAGLDGMNSGILLGDKPTRTFYVVTEGSETISPEVLKLRLVGNTLKIVKSVSLNQNNVITTGHHATLDPSKKFIYVGSKVGELLIINTRTMKIVKVIKTGTGSGHTTFVPQRNLAIVTNHGAEFLTIIDTVTQEKIKNLTVSGASINDVIMQSHTSFSDENGDFFYAFASNNGIFYEVDLSTLSIYRTLYTGGTPVQGCHTYLK